MCDLSFTDHSLLLSEEVSGCITVQYNPILLYIESIIDEGPGVLGHFI